MDDDSSESDRIAATERPGGSAMPLEVAIGWKAPVEVLQHFAEREQDGLHAKSSNGWLYDVVLGLPVLGYNRSRRPSGHHPRHDQKKYYKLLG